jgi:CRISPR-associated protein Cmr4
MGTGGTRLGRVDNTVARDPVTRLPKAPGTGIHGAVRDSYDLNTLVEKVKGASTSQRCAGPMNCKDKGCRTCILFGTAPDSENSQAHARRGIMAFRDGLLSAVPMASMAGPVWVAPKWFAEKIGTVEGALGDRSNPSVATASSLKVLPKKENGEEVSFVNLGSFLFPSKNDQKFSLPEQGNEKVSVINNHLPSEVFAPWANRLVVCHEEVFPLIAETAMEVRTSVAIDPDTGAAEDKKLFTYEAVPAGSVFMVEMDFLGGKFPNSAFEKDEKGIAVNMQSAAPLFASVEKYGFPYLAFTGMGGNVTRGFGRVRFLGYIKEENKKPTIISAPASGQDVGRAGAVDAEGFHVESRLRSGQGGSRTS